MKSVKSRMSLIPDRDPILNLLDIIANDFMLYVVKHTDAQKNPKKNFMKLFHLGKSAENLLVGMSCQVLLVIDVEIRVGVILVIFTPVVVIQYTDSAGCR